MNPSGQTLHLLRHAHSSWARPGQRDHQRPLDERGLRDAAALAQALRSDPPRVDRILCSTAVRARETLDAIASALPMSVPTEFSDDLYALGPDAYLAAAQRHRDCAGLLLVGHNPTIEDLAAALCVEGAPEALETLRRGVGTATWLTIELAAGEAQDPARRGYLRRVREP